MNKQTSIAPAGINTDVLSHVEVELEAHLGTARMTIGELNALREGSVITLATGIGDNVELRLNGTLVALGELVAVDDHFAVRITSIVP